LKTLMLWAVEEKHFWSDNCFHASMKHLICELVELFIDRRCPNYFMLTSNLFSHIEKNDQVGKLVQCLIHSVQNAPFSRHQIAFVWESELSKTIFMSLYLRQSF